MARVPELAGRQQHDTPQCSTPDQVADGTGQEGPPLPATEGLMARPMEGSRAPAAKGMAARLYTNAQARFCRILPSAARDSSKASTTCTGTLWVRSLVLL